MAVDLDQLRTFVAVADAGGLTAAADGLAASLPAISRRLTALEHALGIALLDRGTRLVVLTETGRAFLPRARAVLETLDEGLLGIREAAARRGGSVTLACIPTAAYYFLPATLAAFARALPEIRVRAMDLSAEGVVAAVASGGAEFGVGMAGVPHPDVTFRPLRRDPFVLACRRDHPLAAGRRAIGWRALEGERLVGVSRRSGNRGLIDRTLRGHGIVLRWRYEAEHLSSSLGLVEAGLGVAPVPRLALPRRGHPVLTARALEAPMVEREIGVLARRGAVLGVAARALLALLEARLAAG